MEEFRKRGEKVTREWDGEIICSLRDVTQTEQTRCRKQWSNLGEIIFIITIYYYYNNKLIHYKNTLKCENDFKINIFVTVIMWHYDRNK